MFSLVLPRFFGFSPAAEDRDIPSARSDHSPRGGDAVAHHAADTEDIPRATTIAERSIADVLSALRGTDVGEASQALSDIYLTYFDTLWQFAYRWTRSRDQAEEIVHDVFFRLWTRREALEFGGEIIAYLRLAVRNQIYKGARHSAVIGRMRRAVEEHITDPPAIGSVIHPETSLDEAEIDRIVAKALATFAPRDRDIVTMRFVDRMTLQEIAAILGVSKSRVRTILARVTLRLSTAFEGLRTK